MKRIAQTLFVISLAAAGSALADPVTTPSSAPETSALADSFPNMHTYADVHAADAPSQQAMTYPSAGAQETPLSEEFPSSYAGTHDRNVGRN